ncbi:hypothetical protein FNF31_03002 [Cafeteria roenbergensis]|uniref:EGF-like domain-containing protein n=1 Tax=Cafeteria roenbergensis TaxID=33653 RepID=A0A5A8DFR4_CAFRO|nr:hypothetical protein FNF31_03002 [Cafeteria roenbergensis]KAA0164162.1 hypothetical protein FNF28_03975 [Cafeteria roenbergensis]
MRGPSAALLAFVLLLFLAVAAGLEAPGAATLSKNSGAKAARLTRPSLAGAGHRFRAARPSEPDTTTESAVDDGPKECPGNPVCNDHGACDEDTGECDCEDEWTGDDCSRTNYKAAKAIPIQGTPMDLSTDPDVLEACRLTADAANGACFDYALSYKYVCARFVTAINDLKLYKDCSMSSLERHHDTCTKDKHIGHFAACPKMCAAIIHAWCNKALADRLQAEDDRE